MKLKYLWVLINFYLFKRNEDTEDFQNRGPIDNNFLLEIENKNYIYVGEKLFSFETIDKKAEYSSKDGLNDVKYT